MVADLVAVLEDRRHDAAGAARRCRRGRRTSRAARARAAAPRMRGTPRTTPKRPSDSVVRRRAYSGPSPRKPDSASTSKVKETAQRRAVRPVPALAHARSSCGRTAAAAASRTRASGVHTSFDRRLPTIALRQCMAEDTAPPGAVAFPATAIVHPDGTLEAVHGDAVGVLERSDELRRYALEFHRTAAPLVALPLARRPARHGWCAVTLEDAAVHGADGSVAVAARAGPAAGRADRARARRPDAGRLRPRQRRDRAAPRRRAAHGVDPRGAHPRQARPAEPRGRRGARRGARPAAAAAARRRPAGATAPWRSRASPRAPASRRPRAPAAPPAVRGRQPDPAGRAPAWPTATRCWAARRSPSASSTPAAASAAGR